MKIAFGVIKVFTLLRKKTRDTSRWTRTVIPRGTGYSEQSIRFLQGGEAKPRPPYPHQQKVSPVPLQLQS